MESNLLNAIIDEIALEGLDGITLETLWVRLETRKPSLNLTINTSFKQWVWDGIRSCQDLEFYLLETPRRTLIHIDRFAHLEPETGVVIEQEQDDIYPLTYSKNPPGIKGSCSAPRSDISHVLHKKNDEANETIEMKYKDVVASFGNKLLLVGSQELRYKVLYNHSMLHSDAVHIISDDKLYCLLERIGRCRWNGMTTVGLHENMQVVLKTKPTNAFSMRKNLKRYNLITVQFFCMRPLKGTACITGKLVLLRRFHADHTPSYICQLKQLCHILAEPPNQGTMLLTDVKKKMNVSDELFRKVHKLGTKNVRIETREYRHVYPHATPEEYLTKNRSERRLKVVRLMSPFKMEEDVSKKEEDELDVELEDDDNNATCGITLVRNDVKTACFINETMLNKCYRLVSESGLKGMRLGELLSATGLSVGETRVLWRNLTYRSCFDVIKVEVGKLRVQKLFIRDAHKGLQHNIIMPEQSFCEDKSLSKDETASQHTDRSFTIFNTTNESAELTSPMTVSSLINPDRETDVCGVIPMETLDQTNHLPMPAQEDGFGVCADLSLINSTDGFESSHCGPPDEMQYVKVFNKNSLTQRNLHRAHTIMNTLATHMVVHDTALFKQDVHKEEGTKLFTLKILKRLLNSLNQQGFLKIVHRKEKINDNVEKEMEFYCLPGVSEDSEEFRRALQHRKAKERIILSAKYRALNPCKNEIKLASTNRMPKFEKARNIHIFLWGLLRKEEGAKGNYDWLPYVSPLPKLHDHPEGWLNVNDVLENMPLSLLTTTVLSCSLKEEDIGPSKHTFFKHLPPQLMNKLSIKRRHFFKFESVCELLVKLGLLTFEKRDLLRKEEMHIYVHQKGSLVDKSFVQHATNFCPTLTTRSDGTISFQFNTMKEIEAYWDILKFVCLASNNETPLCPSKINKKKFNELLLGKEVGSVRDEGEIPGDGQGPAGIDSSLFGTLKRNWLSVEVLSTPNKEFVENSGLGSNLVKRGPSVGSKQLKKRSNVSSSHHDTSNQNNAISSEESKTTKKSIKKNNTGLNEEELNKKRIKEELNREKKRLRKLKCYDVKDEEAKKSMTSLRVTWSLEEDKVILLCTLANIFLSGKLKWMVHTSAIRDFLHEIVPGSKTKTSAACMRRKNFQVRKESVSNMLSVQLASLLHHKELCRRFKAGEENAPRDENVFRQCLHAINLKLKIIPDHHFSNNDSFADEGDCEVLQLPASIDAIQQKYNICRPSVAPPIYFKHPITTQQTHFFALQNIMHSVGLLSDKIGRSHELLQLINNTSSTTLYSVIKSLVDFGVLNRLKKPDTTLTPSVLGSYRIAHRYQFIWSTIYPKSICVKWNSFLGVDADKDLSEEDASYDESHNTGHQTKVVSSKSSTCAISDDGYVRLTNSSECASLITCMLASQLDMVIETTVPKEIVVVEMSSKTQSNKSQVAKDDEKNYSFDMNDLEDEDEDDEEYNEEGKLKTLTETPQASAVHSRTFLYWYRSQYAHAKTLKYSEASNNLFVNGCDIRVQVPASFKVVEAVDDKRRSACVNSVYALERVCSYNQTHHHLHPFTFRVLLKHFLSTVPHQLDVSQAMQTCLQVLSRRHNCMDDVRRFHDFVHASTHIGVTMLQLKEKFPHLTFSMIKHFLCIMTSLSLVVRVGLLDMRWVSFEHVHSWVVSVKRNLKGRGVFNTDKCQFNFEDFDIESTIKNNSKDNSILSDGDFKQSITVPEKKNSQINLVNINEHTADNINTDTEGNNNLTEAKVVFKSGGCVLKAFNDFSFSKVCHNQPFQPSNAEPQNSSKTSSPNTKNSHVETIPQHTSQNSANINNLPLDFADHNYLYDNQYACNSTENMVEEVSRHYNYNISNHSKNNLNCRKRKLDENQDATSFKLWKGSEGNEFGNEANNKTCDNFRLRSLKLLEVPSQTPCTLPVSNIPSFPSITPSFSNQLTPLSNHTLPPNPSEPSALLCSPSMDPVSTISTPFIPDHNFYMVNNMNSAEYSGNNLGQFDGACDEDESSNVESPQRQKPSPKKRKVKKKNKLDHDSTATGTYKTLRIIPRPWKTPEGTLNRNVLATMLQSILLHILQNPGITQHKLTSKYEPTLQPIVVLELVEVLENMGTVNITYTSSLCKPSLFSPTTIRHSDAKVATLTADNNCLSKMAPFLSQLFKNKSS